MGRRPPFRTFHSAVQPLPRALAAVLAAALGAALAAVPAVGQAVAGRVTSQDDGRPVQGAFVVLFGEAGARESAVITDLDGRYLLRAGRPGRYALQVERIGFETVRSPLLELGTATAEYAFVVATRAIALPAITVELAGRGCARMGEGPEVQALWDEIRKALDVARWADEAAGVRYVLVRHEREVDMRHERLFAERRAPHVGSAVQPYTVSRPAAELVRDGFVAQDGRDLILYAPDAGVLLSDEFLDAYCFSLVRGQAGEAGLRFAPMRRRRAADVTGVLWVDRSTAELRRLQYGYTSLPGDLAQHAAGGAMQFRRLPGGLWIVDQWHIRGPLVQRAGHHGPTSQLGVREEGGVVMSARGRDGAVLYSRDGAGVVEGHYIDRVLGRPGGVIIHLSGTPHAVAALPDGRFRLEGVPPGRYAIAFSDTWVEDLRVPVALDSIVVAAGVVVHDVLGPTRDAVLRTLCPRVAPGSHAWTDGLLYGIVNRPDTGESIAGVEVRAEWDEDGRRRWRTAQTDEDGLYILCRVPWQRAVTVNVRTRGYVTAPMELLPGPPFRRHDIRE
jgi:hypothetical protein